jgi:hypothetical protein
MNKFYTGCVESRNDPLKLGRCQVRIVGLHTEDKTVLPTSDLPWAYPVTPITSAGVSGIGSAPIGPVEGSWVLIMFMDPDEQVPMMMGTLGGVAQIPNANDDPTNITINNTNFDGTVEPAPGAAPTTTETAPAKDIKDGNIVTDPNSITGPLAALIAKGESGAAGYNAFNRGSKAPKGTGSTGGEKLTLVSMPIKDIMAQQALPSGAPDKLFAVGKYQCIPETLSQACKALNIDTNQCFTQQTQDIICQNYLVGIKRPKLIAYYNNPDKNNETLLKEAGKSLAAEFASIEDPYYPGFPYNGEQGTYYKHGNKVHTTYAVIKTTLVQEWDFRNSKTNPPPTASLGGADKIAKGADYSGVAKAKPIDDSVKTPATPSVKAQSIPNVGVPAIPGIGNFGGILNTLGVPSDLLASITSAQTQFTEFVNSIDITGPITDLVGDGKSLLKDFGDNLSDIATNLGIDNPTGSVTELVSNLGIANPTPEKLVAALEERAGSTSGQAKALLAKLDNEPTMQKVSAIGTKNPDGTISTGSAVDPTKGFQDPNGQYPKYKNEQDTNRLASGNNLGRTIVLQKEAALKHGIKIANGGTWDQSPVPYNAVYPYNHVAQTESGHVTEFDDTPGAERIHFYHRTGSFVEWDANGTQVNRIVGDNFEIMERNGFVYVKGALNVTVDGALNIRTDNVLNLEVSGAANINIYNNANVNVSGNANMAVGGAFNVHANQINMESAGQFNIKAATGLNIEAGSDLNIKTDGSLYLDAAGNINNTATGSIYINTDADANILANGVLNVQSLDDTNIKSGGVINTESSGNMNLKSGGIANMSSTGKLSIHSDGDVAIDGAILDMQDGVSDIASGASTARKGTPAHKAGVADLELPIETRGTSGTTFLPPLSVKTRGIETSYETNEVTTPGAFNAYRASRIANNEASTSEIKSQKFVQDSSKPTAASATSGIQTDDSAIMNMSPDAFNAGLRLTKNWTLGELTANGTRIPRVSYAVKSKQTDTTTYNLSPQDIVANLKALCENVLEPLTEKYGKESFRITSAFRRPPIGNQMGDLGRPDWGDHTHGCAVDICFVGGKVKNYEICKTLPGYLKSWHQIIMEYDNPTDQKGHWIHISYRRQNNAGNCFSMNNHRICVAGVNAGFVLV